MDIFDRSLLDSLDSIIVYLCLPCLPHGLVSLSNDLEAGTNSLGRSLSDKQPLVSEANPYLIKYKANKCVHQCLCITTQLPEDQNSTVASLLHAIRL